MDAFGDIAIGIITGLISGAVVAYFQWLHDEKGRFEQDKNEYAKYLDLVQLELSKAYENHSDENLERVLCNSPTFYCLSKYEEKNKAVSDALNEVGKIQEEVVKLTSTKEISSATIQDAAVKQVQLGLKFSLARLHILKLKFNYVEQIL